MKRKILDTLRLLWKAPVLEKLLVNLTMNKPLDSFFSKVTPNHYQYSQNSIREVVRDNIRYRLDISDIIDWCIYFGFKESSKEMLYSLMSKGQTIIDVGANVGDITMHSAKIVGAYGAVYSFEPDLENYRRLEKNLKLNKFTNITVNNFGLGNEKGIFYMKNINSKNRGMNKIVSKDMMEGTHEIKVNRLDSYVKENKLDKVDLIKIDVEGFEYNVLQSSTETIKKFHPIFFIELNDKHLIEQGSSAKELVQFLENENYTIINSETNQFIDSNTSFDHCHYDIVARHVAKNEKKQIASL